MPPSKYQQTTALLHQALADLILWGIASAVLYTICWVAAWKLAWALHLADAVSTNALVFFPILALATSIRIARALRAPRAEAE